MRREALIADHLADIRSNLKEIRDDCRSAAIPSLSEAQRRGYLESAYAHEAAVLKAADALAALAKEKH